MLLEELRTEVWSAARQMVADHLAHGAQGNISALDEGSGMIAITPTAIPYDQMQVGDIAVIDSYGKLVDGRWRPTSETPMHTIFYREAAGVKAVVHSHAPYASVFAITSQPIPIVLIEAALSLGAPVPVAPYRRPGTDELARIVLDTIGDGNAVLLAQHGLLTTGATLAQAYESTLAAEMTARLVIMARSMNLEPGAIEPAEAAFMRQMYLRKYRPEAVLAN
jgi:ribulose-5-phosphate 4-epimerase/fuculose-1-phosphate aldolase